MNPIAGDLLRDGWQLRADIGEQVSFRDTDTMVPMINRAPGAREKDRYNFEEDTASIIELSPALDEPQAGEFLLDSFGRYHRIQQVHWDFVCWVVGCSVEATPS